MFDNLELNQSVPQEKTNPAQAPAPFPPQAKVDDIFAGVKDVGLPNSKNGQMPPESLKVANKPQGSGMILKILIVVILILILAIVGLVVASRYFGFNGLSKFLPQNEVQVPVEEKKVTQPPVDNVEVGVGNEKTTPSSGMPGMPIETVPVATTSVVTPTDIQQIATSVSPVVPPVIPNTSIATTTQAATSTTIEKSRDTDGDGLLDEQETLFGTDLNKQDTDGDALLDGEEVNTHKTNPLKVDTDNDELSDFDEVKVYLTNPNNQDTDADTFLDGKEVKGGYNPKGPGKLVK